MKNHAEFYFSVEKSFLKIMDFLRRAVKTGRDDAVSASDYGTDFSAGIFAPSGDEGC